jgi:hypothetical protein
MGTPMSFAHRDRTSREIYTHVAADGHDPGGRRRVAAHAQAMDGDDGRPGGSRKIRVRPVILCVGSGWRSSERNGRHGNRRALHRRFVPSERIAGTRFAPSHRDSTDSHTESRLLPVAVPPLRGDQSLILKAEAAVSYPASESTRRGGSGDSRTGRNIDKLTLPAQ